MNDFLSFFQSSDHRFMSKLSHYFEVYERFFSRFRGRQVRICELGVSHGGSLQMWKSYFGSQAQIVGVDIKSECLNLAEEQISVEIGDAGDPAFLESLKQTHGPFDIVVDDAGHFASQQLTSFRELYPSLSPDGVYLCEDLWCALLPEYEGGLAEPNTLLSHSKVLVDQLHAWYARGNTPPIDWVTKSTFSISFFPGMVVFEKRPMRRPEVIKSGATSF